MTPSLRLGSDDEYVWSSVYVNNEYRLPVDMIGWRVLDIGGNIGAFALACCERGASHVTSYEPCEANQAIYAMHLHDVQADVVLRPEAVWGGQGMVMLRACANPKGHSCHSLVMNLSQPGVLVPVVPFGKALVQESLEGYLRWDLVKIDCEGAEYALFDCSSEVIHLSKRYVIEFHLSQRHDESCERMMAFGYKRDWRHDDPKMGTSIMHFSRVD